jgi:hypothetical protein
MGIFRHDLTEPGRDNRTAVGETLSVSMSPQVQCDRCCVAEAQVEVVTDAGPVYFCQHHYREHRDSIIAAGHVIRTRSGAGRDSYIPRLACRPDGTGMRIKPTGPSTVAGVRSRLRYDGNQTGSWLRPIANPVSRSISGLTSKDR